MCWHRWSKWEMKSGHYVLVDNRKNVVIPGTESVDQFQERRCEKCGKYQREDLP